MGAQRAWLSWSSGKDSAWTLHEVRLNDSVEVTGLLTTITEPFE
jgi:diphthamide synthase (EF-2-diphthine--ammonia ligase)